jgi:4-amino-4-deoxy-L-arabinose transferase-like glycosyltransferase
LTRKERWQLLGIWFFLGLVPLLMRPLWEPDEARYAEIPREMLALGDWLTPRLNHVLYFEKPPLQYWLSALSMKAFGLQPFAARLPLALATLITLWCGWRLSRRLGARTPVWAAFMAVTGLLAYVCGQILTLDALFAAFQVLALVAGIEAVAARFDQRPALGWTLLAFLALALATLTKGLAAPVLVGVIFLASLFWVRGADRLRAALLRTLLDPLGWLVFLGVAGPWFILVNRAHPGHAQFFFVHEHFQRFTSHIHDRAGSKNPVLDKFYFLGFLALGSLPWLSAAVVGLRQAVAFLGRARTGPQGQQAPLVRWTVATTLLGCAVPLLFYSVSGSKLPPYILPVVLPLMALACAFEREGDEPAAVKRSGYELLGLGVILLLAGPFALKEKAEMGWVLAAGAGFTGMGCWALRPRHLTGSRWMAGLGAALLLLSWAATRVVGPAKDISPFVRQAPADAQWISCGNLYQAIPFLTRQRMAVVAGTGELAYGRDHLAPAERDRWFQEEIPALTPLARRMRAEDPARPVWTLADRDAWHDLPDAQKADWEVVTATHAGVLARLR